MATQNVPVETWQTILRYAIAVPVFFEVDPVESCGIADYMKLYYKDAPYWRSERHRNKLRQVCLAWNVYLRQFDHRFVTLLDIRKKLIPLLALTKAIRIDCNTGRLGEDAVERRLNKAIRKYTGPWELEILQGHDSDIDEIIIHSGRTPRLRSTLQLWDLTFHNVFEPTSEVRFIEGYYFSFPSPVHQIRLWNLTSLRLNVSNIVPWTNCELPSLKHLSIFVDEATLDPSNIIELLRHIGKNLVTFFDISIASDLVLSDEVWRLCPSLERFQTPFRWHFDSFTSLSPSLHLIRISYELLGRASIERYLPPWEVLLNKQIKEVSFAETWAQVVQSDLMWMENVGFIMSHGVDLFDMTGLRFQDFIVGMLIHRKANYRRPPLVRYWDEDVHVF